MTEPRAKAAANVKLFNGRGQWHKTRGETGHIYIGARGISHAVRLMREAGFELTTRHEIAVYFNKNAWGNSMEGVKPEFGVWAMEPGKDWTEEKPVRFI